MSEAQGMPGSVRARQKMAPDRMPPPVGYNTVNSLANQAGMCSQTQRPGSAAAILEECFQRHA